jgi:hypothetical protein
MEPRFIIYVSSSVTYASESYRDFIKRFKEELRSATSALVIEWVDQNATVLPDNFFQRNLNNVLNCDVMIAITNEPSIGVGMEIQEAIRAEKPLLCLHEKGKTISRLLVGAKKAGRVKIETYGSMEEAINLAADFVDALTAELAANS